MENTHHEDTLLQRCIYYGAVLGIALWVIWIGWMPFIQVSFFLVGFACMLYASLL